VGKGSLVRQGDFGEFQLPRDPDGAVVVHARVDGGMVTIFDRRGQIDILQDFGRLPAGSRLAFAFPNPSPGHAGWRFAKIEVRSLE
jgi:hypothetical protein